MSDDTIIYSADVWPSVAIGMPEVQAHVMSYPQEPVDDLTAARNEILRLSAELAHRTQVWEGEEFRLRGELSEARAEIVKLLDEVARLRGCAPAPSCPSIKISPLAYELDPRLGLPQPDGDPVEPMSAKKQYRWGMV